MTDVRPFSAWRYDIGQVGPLSEVVAPPCDHITPELREKLYARSEFNVSRLTRAKPPVDDPSPEAAAAVAADTLRHWRSERVLVRDHAEAVYVIHQHFQADGRECVRRGFLARVRVETEGIRPHEQLRSDDVADRLALLRAAQMNLSPVFGFYDDRRNRVQQGLDAATAGVTAFEVVDTDAVLNRVWPVTDPSALEAVRDFMSDRAIYIADGHHRFAAAAAYARDFEQDRGRHPASFVLMHLVGTGDPGLTVEPTHRVLSGLPPVTSAELQRGLADKFDFESAATAEEAWQLAAADGRGHLLVLGTADGRWTIALSRTRYALAADTLNAALLPAVQNAWPDTAATVRPVAGVGDASGALVSGDAQVACLLPPPSLEQIQAVADQGQRFPAKCTYFTPKTPAGLVFYPLT